jgi:hypothetical protein
MERTFDVATKSLAPFIRFTSEKEIDEYSATYWLCRCLSDYRREPQRQTFTVSFNLMLNSTLFTRTTRTRFLPSEPLGDTGIAAACCGFLSSSRQ